ncbi:DUF551 domain-containing protein, partial [Salmonella enterica]|nr:DUF551 domain-containing protein [Salmonella enterica]
MTTITKERIELFIKNPLENGLTRGEQMEVARIALASLEAEPVSQTYKLNELSGNSPVTPDGWISCSERMPEETGDIIVVSDGIVMSGISYSRRDGFYMAALEYDDDEPIDGVTHW